MDSMVEENGANSSIDSLNSRGATGNGTDSSTSGAQVEGANVTAKQMHNNNNSEFPANMLMAQTPGGLTVLKNSPTNIVHLMPSSAPVSLQSPQSVIQSSVIQSANNVQPSSMAYKVVYAANKGNSVIQAPGIKIKSEPNSSGSLGAMDSNSDDDDSCSDDDTASKKRRDMLTRRPSYHKILKDISGPDMSVLSGPVVAEDQSRKREIRLQKNREAARECRRKKKEYIKCLENRVAVLENQNKALIEELKTLKELYCMTKTE